MPVNTVMEVSFPGIPDTNPPSTLTDGRLTAAPRGMAAQVRITAAYRMVTPPGLAAGRFSWLILHRQFSLRITRFPFTARGARKDTGFILPNRPSFSGTREIAAAQTGA